jgi:hypothetical protein
MSRQILWGPAEPSVRLIEERVRRLEADVALLTHAVQALARELAEHREQEEEDVVPGPGRAGGGPPTSADDVAAGGPPASVGDVATGPGRAGGGAPDAAAALRPTPGASGPRRRSRGRT